MIIKDLLNFNNKEKFNLFQLRQKHYGLHNKNKILYYINESDEKLGFFAMYRYWMEYLYFADICGYIPVINVDKNCTYHEKGMILGTNNVFEYYFKQPSAITLNELKQSDKVIYSDTCHREMVELVLTGKRGHYYCNTRYKYFMSKIVNKYLNFNQATSTYVNTGLDNLSFRENKILGVHIRGTDFRKKYNRHPVFVTAQDCFKCIDGLFKESKYSKIFLATDDESILREFISEYGENVCYYTDVFRSNDRRSVAFHENNRDKNKYKLGLEVIRDMYTLSQCDGLVAGISQVAICAQINKLARKESYDDITIIDKGIYKNYHYF